MHFNTGRKRPDMLGDKNPARRSGMGKKISDAKKGWNGLKGKRYSKEHRRNISVSLKGKYVDEKSKLWKGDKVCRRTLHMWVEKHRGKPSKCEHCGCTEIPDGKKRWFDWANKSHKYLRDLDDWIRLCKECHKRYDLDFLKNLNHARPKEDSSKKRFIH